VANEFLQTEVKKIAEDGRWTFPLNTAMVCAYLMAHYKGENLKIFDMSKGSSLCDFHVIATAHNTMQASSMIDEIARQLRDLGTEVRSIEGRDSVDWTLLDTGDVIVHVFQENSRDLYDLDTVFAGNPAIQIPEEFYFSGPVKASAEETLKGFF